MINYYTTKEGYKVTTYTLGSGDECWPSPHTWSYVGDLQKNGVFDACVFSKPRVDVERLSEGIAKGMLIKIDGIRGGQGDAGIARLFGPSNVAVAYKKSAGDIGDEYFRWEYDYDRRRKEWIGTKFEVPEMVRALTGLPSDHFMQAFRLSPSEAVGTVHQAVLRRMPIADHAVRDYFYKLREHKEKEVAWKKPVPMELDAEDWRKLSEIAKAACTKDPNKAAECEGQLMSSFKHVFRN